MFEDNRFNESSGKHVRSAISRISIDQERRRSDLVFNQDVQSTEHVVKGNTLIVGAGEVLVEAHFPVVYIRPPSFTFGGELSADSFAQAGQFPTISAVVNQWLVEEPDLAVYGASARKYYRGAVLACVITGPGTQKLVLHWTFMGLALSNPGSRTSTPLSANFGEAIT